MAISWTQLTTGSYVEITKVNCQYFNSTDVNDVVGFLENGKKYVAQSVTTNQISGYTWIKILVNGSVYYTAYLKDRINFATDIWINYHSEGIDVSKFQKTVDFQQVKDAGYEFALIRVVSTDSNGLYIDPYFESNVQAARAAGLKIGVYIYTYALNEAQLDTEINKAVTVLSKYSFEYPIYLDYEDKSLQTMGKANVTNLCRYGFNKLMSLGYYPGLYSGHYWSTNYIDAAALSDYPFWLAHYTAQTTSTLNYGVWQYGGKAVPGVTSGNCDVNYGYIDCEPYINWKGLNNKTATVPFTPTPPPTPPTPPTPINNNVNVRICPRYGTQEQWNLCKTHIPLKSEMCITQNVGIKYGDGVTTWENLTYENIASVSSKVDKVLGKDLSTNDYTNADKSSVTTSAEQRHTHDNKSILDSITTTLIDGWQSAVTHITDTVKHITDAERTLWNSKSNGDHNHNGVYEPVITKKSAFNKEFGIGVGTVCQGDDIRLSNARPASGGNSDTVGGKYTAELQDYNNLTNKPIIPSGVEVINNLYSTSASASLSANMGKTLNENKFNKPITSTSKPSGQAVGDVWNQII